jgi:hypothetical protein
VPRPARRTPPVPLPHPKTLRKYGLTGSDYAAILLRQKMVCPVCGEPLLGRKLVVDHAHVRRFKRMKAADKRKHVRGVLHSFCNRYVRGWLTRKRAAAILAYLNAHHSRSTDAEAGT